MKILFIGLIIMGIGGCVAINAPERHVRIAGTYYRKGEYRKAVDECSKALAIDPFNKEAHYNAGVAYTKLEEWNNAINSFQQALWIHDLYPEPRYGLAYAYYQIKDYKKAKKEITYYLQLTPQDEKAQELLHAIQKEEKP